MMHEVDQVLFLAEAMASKALKLSTVAGRLSREELARRLEDIAAMARLLTADLGECSCLPADEVRGHD